MTKQRLFTAIGVAFALLIVFGGWVLTSSLLDQKETALLSGVGSIKVTLPKEPTLDATYPTLTESEIYTVLNLWSLDVEETPHEPKEGQLSIEQAIDAGKNGLAYFSEQGLIPKEFVVYDKINASLCEKKLSPTQLIGTSPFIKPEEIRDTQELERFYSYWTLSFSSEKANATLVINAATGQIWKAKIDFPISNNSFGAIENEKISKAFMDYLTIQENPLVEAVVLNSNTKIDEDTSQFMIDIHLSTK